MSFAEWNPLRRWREKRARAATIEQIHGEIVASARAPELYAVLGAPDDLDGRFEMIVLHGGLILRRFGEFGASAHVWSQEIIDRIFIGFDDALREMSIGDSGVQKRLRLMASAFYGRTAVYHAALDSGNPRALAEALAKNLYRGKVSSDDSAPRLLAERAFAVARALETVSFERLTGGAFHFPRGQGGELDG